MGERRQHSSQLGATFIPGGIDDFYMPTEVVSPAPQRIIPEVPGKMQENLAALELDATPANRLSGLQSPPPPTDGYGSAHQNFPSRNSSVSNLTTMSELPSQDRGGPQRPVVQGVDSSDQPSFSPFPPLKKRPVNVPPPDEEKETILEKARIPVLNSNDPEVQLTWASDALLYVEIAAQNETRASSHQGARPSTPQIEHQLRVDAVNIIRFLADQQHPKAEFLRGMWLEFGKFGFRMDKKEAFRSYQRAAQKGYARAEYRIGMQFESSNEPEKAIKHYKLGVQQGDSASNYRLGMMTLLGQHGQPLDYQRGIKLISYSAETADENAPQGAYVFGMLQARELPQINLPEAYLPLNVAGARFNIEKAAYLGFAKAQAKMGSAYELCQLGCDFDPALSLHYNALAARQGEPDAEMAISKWFLCGYDGIFKANEEMAFSFAQRAAQSGLGTAEFAMGYFHEVGIYVRPDLAKSRNWYQKAAEHGNKDAVARIDGLSRSKTLSRKDHENVAVARIQSQHGSHRGKRPDRFKTPMSPMPTIADDYNPIDMPEPKLPKIRPGEYRPSPYAASGPESRPPTAPYPLDEHATPQSPYRKPPLSSAQGLRKPVTPLPISPVQSETSFADSNYRGSAFPTFKPSLQSTASSPAITGRGGPPPTQAQGTPGLGYRKPPPTASAPNSIPSPAPQPPRPHTTQPPTLDIGFSAPQDLSGADRPRRTQGPPETTTTRPPPGALPRVTTHDGLASPKQDRLSSLPHSSTMPANHQSSSPQRRPMSAGTGAPVSHAPKPPGPMRVDGASLESHAPPKLPRPDKPAATPPPAAIATAPKPPGKGPKTFSEMGLPPTKQENDCVVM